MKTIEEYIEKTVVYDKKKTTLSPAQKQSLKLYVKTLHRCSDASKLIYLARMRRFGDFIKKTFEEVTKIEIDYFLSTIKNSSTYDAYVETLKNFYGVFLRKKKLVAHLKAKNFIKKFTPAELLAPEEAVQLANATASEMYKSCVLTLYESSARISEVLGLRIGDVVFSTARNKNGVTTLIATLHFQRGKGNMPKQPIVMWMFALELKRWIENHPHKNNSNAYVFYSIRHSPDANVPLAPRSVQRMLQIAKRVTGIKKRVNPHWLRHSGLSYCANELNYNEQLLMWRAGWTTTAMARRYIHSGAEIENKAYLGKMGLVAEEKTIIIKPKPCPHCSQLNPYTNINCDACGMPLDLAKYKEALEKKHLTTLGLEEIQKQMSQMWHKLEELALTLKVRNQELIARYVATNNPTSAELVRFLEEQKIDKDILKEIDEIAPHNGQWFYVGKQ